MKRIAVMTAGGDAPGMNAAVRSIVRTGIYNGLEVWGIEKAYLGMIEGLMKPLSLKDVGGIMQKGGTVLQTTRCEEFITDEGQMLAVENLEKNEIDGVAVIGGDGSLTGALDLHNRGIKVIGVPATIDNDLWGTDMSIGVDTALNTIIYCVDNIKDTASSHERAFIIEVMGRKSGYLALMAAIATGAEEVYVPEREMNLEATAARIQEGHRRGKTHGIIILAEGAGNAYTIGRQLKNFLGYDVRISILGHIQRGGSPSAFDRQLGSMMGAEAVRALTDGKSGLMVALSGASYSLIPIQEAVENKKNILEKQYEIAQILAL
ncbi:MAG TPA: 6-phosphofructokinase [Firmicutes bacterium]|nr:6-phosphofructokinase [Bacillota bacterium]